MLVVPLVLSSYNVIPMYLMMNYYFQCINYQHSCSGVLVSEVVDEEVGNNLPHMNSWPCLQEEEWGVLVGGRL